MRSSYHRSLMTAKLASLVLDVASSLEVSLEAAAAANAAAWLTRLEEWNARIDLTAARTREELVDLMVVDALVLAARIPQGLEVVDVGTGAGGPGLALAIFRRDLRVTLVEARAKRVSFLRAVIDEIGRPDIAIERTRGEALGSAARWDVALSRATLSPTAWLDLGVKLVSPSGTVWVFLAKEEPPAHPRAVAEKDIAYRWPLTAARRRVLAYRVR
jgi:16S rRNA (guanine527-N7)-methyltransferase